MNKLKQFFSFFIGLFYSLSFIFLFSQILAEDNNITNNKKSIKSFCENALEFYLDRPDLETKFLRRLEYCKSTIIGVSPIGYQVNPILSDFKSMF